MLWPSVVARLRTNSSLESRWLVLKFVPFGVASDGDTGNPLDDVATWRWRPDDVFNSGGAGRP